MLFSLAKDLVKAFLNRALVIHIFRAQNHGYTINDYIKYAYTFHDKITILPPNIRSHFSIAPFQLEEEMNKLLEILTCLEPKVLMEIGTANGGTLFLLSMVASSDALIISVDLPGGRFGGSYPPWKASLYGSFARDSQKIDLIRANSQDPKTLEAVREILGGRQLDFLFIDGDHTYSGVKKDFEMYSSLAKKQGIIAFHDIVPGPQEMVGGVPRFWLEIRNKYRHLEIVRNWNQGGYGIGVINV